MDIQFTENEESFRQEIRDFLRQELPDGWDPMGQGSPYSPEQFPFTKNLSKKLSDKGWLTLAWPEEYGGQARSIMEQLVYREEMTYWGAPGTDLGVGAEAEVQIEDSGQGLLDLLEVLVGEALFLEAVSVDMRRAE